MQDIVYREPGARVAALAPFRLAGQLEDHAVALKAVGPDGAVAMTATAAVGDA